MAKEPAPKPREIRGTAARQVLGAKTHTALQETLEIRRIVVAHGIDFHNEKCKLAYFGWRIPEDLGLAPNTHLLLPLAERVKKGYTKQPRELATLTENADGSREYINREQRVKYILKFVNSKEEFIKALKTPQIMVVYSGHARYGRGPCFSDPDLHSVHKSGWYCPRPCENWADDGDDDREEWGLFRWGYKYIPVPASEIIYYGYRAAPVLSSVKLRSPRLRRARHPDIKLGSDEKGPLLKLTQLDQFIEQLTRTKTELQQLKKRYEKLPDKWIAEDLWHLLGKTEKGEETSPEDLRNWLKDVPPGGRFWVQRHYAYAIWWKDKANKIKEFEKWFEVPEVVQVAGWHDTSVQPYDLGGTVIKCRCLCHFACFTRKHNFNILTLPEYKNWRQKGNERYSYFTTNEGFSFGTIFFIYHVLTFNKRSAGLPWKELLETAVSKTNEDLKQCNVEFRIVPDKLGEKKKKKKTRN